MTVPVNLFVAIELLGDYIKGETTDHGNDGPTDIGIEWMVEDKVFNVEVRWWHHDGAIVEFCGKHAEITVALGLAFNELKTYKNSAASALKELSCG